MIRTIHPGLYPVDPLYLFDMQADPHETTNLAADRGDVVAELDHRLMEWISRYTTGVDRVSDPFQDQLNAGVLPDLYCSRAEVEQRLIDVGRADQLADLWRRMDVKPSFIA
jgi:hypothetical protein